MATPYQSPYQLDPNKMYSQAGKVYKRQEMQDGSIILDPGEQVPAGYQVEYTAPDGRVSAVPVPSGQSSGAPSGSSSSAGAGGPAAAAIGAYGIYEFGNDAYNTGKEILGGASGSSASSVPTTPAAVVTPTPVPAAPVQTSGGAEVAASPLPPKFPGGAPVYPVDYSIPATAPYDAAGNPIIPMADAPVYETPAVGFPTDEALGGWEIDSANPVAVPTEGTPWFDVGTPSYAGYIAAIPNVYNGISGVFGEGAGQDKAQNLTEQGALAVANVYTGGLAGLAHGLLMRTKFGQNLDAGIKKFDKNLGWFSPTKALGKGFDALGLGLSTKDIERIRWGEMSQDSKYQDLMGASYLANHPENDTGIYQDGPFAGKRWDQVSRDELIANDPLSGNLWLGNLETVGDRWHEIPLDRRAEIIKRAQAEGLYSDDKGDVIIFSENQPRFLQIVDEVVGGDTPDAGRAPGALPLPNGAPGVPQPIPPAPATVTTPVQTGGPAPAQGTIHTADGGSIPKAGQYANWEEAVKSGKYRRGSAKAGGYVDNATRKWYASTDQIPVAK